MLNLTLGGVARAKTPSAEFRSNKAAEYRERAERIRAIAVQISLSETRSQLLQSALHWEILATEERPAREAASKLESELEA